MEITITEITNMRNNLMAVQMILDKFAEEINDTTFPDTIKKDYTILAKIANDLQDKLAICHKAMIDLNVK